MATGARWRLHVGDDRRTLTLNLREQWPNVGPVDLTGHQSVTVTITRLADRAQVQQSIAAVVDEAGGVVTIDTADLVATLPGYCQVVATVVWPTVTRSLLVGMILVEGLRPTTGADQPPLDLGDEFVIHVHQWDGSTPVAEVQLLGPDLLPIDDPEYLWDDPGDATDQLVDWPGDPATLTDQPTP